MAKYLVYTKRDGFDFYAVDTHAAYTFAFSQNTIQDLEVLDETKVTGEISTFLQTNKILPGTCDIVLSDSVMFTNDFIKQAPAQPVSGQSPSLTQINQQEDRDKLEVAIASFIKAVPFEEVASKTIQMGNGFRVVAVNKDLYTALINAFKAQNIQTEAVAPVALVTGSLQNPPALTPDLLQLISRSPDLLKQNNFLVSEKVVAAKLEETAKKSSPVPEQESKTRQYALIGVFCVLLLVLGIVVYKNVIAPPKPKPTAASTIPNAAPTSAISTTVSSQQPSIAQSNIHIDIKTQTTSSTSAVLRNQLITAGFSSTTVIAEAIHTVGVNVIFDTSVPPGIQQSIFEAVKLYYPQARTAENSIGQYHTIITLGN